MLGGPLGPTPLRICTTDNDCTGAAGTRCFAGVCATRCTDGANCQDLCADGTAGCAVCSPVGICVQSCTGGQSCNLAAGYRCTSREPNRGVDNGGLECRLTCNSDTDCNVEQGYGCVGGLCRVRCQDSRDCESRAPTHTVSETDPTGQQVQRSLSYSCAAGRCMLGCTGSSNKPDPTLCNQGDRFRCLRPSPRRFWGAERARVRGRHPLRRPGAERLLSGVHRLPDPGGSELPGHRHHHQRSDQPNIPARSSSASSIPPPTIQPTRSGPAGPM